MLENLALETVMVLGMRRTSRYVRDIVMMIRLTRVMMVTRLSRVVMVLGQRRHLIVRATKRKEFPRQHPGGGPYQGQQDVGGEPATPATATPNLGYCLNNWVAMGGHEFETVLSLRWNC
jgi:hypothetical protein